MTAVTEEKGGGTLRHTILALLVAAFMAVMMALSALPAMAAHVAPSKETGGGSQNKGADVLHCGTSAGGGNNVRPPEPATPVSAHFSCN